MRIRLPDITPDITLDANGNVQLVEGFKQMRLGMLRRLEQIRRQQAMHWALGLAYWINRWTSISAPVDAMAEALLFCGDRALTGVLREIAVSPVGIKA